ncbi:MAG: 50S ribosomal protein L11 methyltransferase [Chloroflexi bacterium]|nr:50S ribosomal protein L11 methyltransferase [Chloroflexota bacterium]
MLDESIAYCVPPELVDPLVEVMATYGKRAPQVVAGADHAIVTTRLPNTRAGSEQRGRIEAAARLLGRIAPIEAKTLTLPSPADGRGEEGTAWALRVGRFVVNPGRGYELATTDLRIDLEASKAFGTGWHPSTQLCLEAVERQVGEGSRVLDVGAGSGILSIAAARLGAREVVSLDTSLDAVRATRRNARVNGVSRRIRPVHGTMPQPGLGTFDVVVINISARVACALAAPAREAMTPTGVLLVAGVLETQRAEVAAALRSAGLRAIEETGNGEWLCLTAHY